MAEKSKLFMKILIAELEDLEDDFETWGQYLDEKHKADKISEYVFLQNNATLRQEIANTRMILDDIMKDRIPAGSDLETIREHFMTVVKEESERYQFKKAVTGLVQKKIDKVYGFLKGE